AGGPEPQVVVHARRHRAVLGQADRLAQAIDDRLAGVHPAETPGAQKLFGLCAHRAAATLRSDFHDAVVSPRRVDHPPALDDVVADRLLDVDILAGLASP